MRTQRKIINLFDEKNIYSIKSVMSVNDEEDLNQFWDYLRNSNNTTHSLIHNFVIQFYNFALSYIETEESEFFEIILEENDTCFYFTLWNKKIALLFQEYLGKSSIESLYQQNRISIKLTKEKCKENLEILHQREKNREKNLIKSVTKPKKVKKIPAYTFIEQDDLEELINLNEDLQDFIYQMQKIGLNEDIFISIRSTFSLFCLTLRYYDAITPITTTITEFSHLMNANKDKFLELDSFELELIHGFINNIGTWLNTLFIQGGADINFMDHSIDADFQTILMLIKDEDIAENSNLDDIFDF